MGASSALLWASSCLLSPFSLPRSVVLAAVSQLNVALLFHQVLCVSVHSTAHRRTACGVNVGMTLPKESHFPYQVIDGLKWDSYGTETDLSKGGASTCELRLARGRI